LKVGFDIENWGRSVLKTEKCSWSTARRKMRMSDLESPCNALKHCANGFQLEPTDWSRFLIGRINSRYLAETVDNIGLQKSIGILPG
jgi:hypothetical protein